VKRSFFYAAALFLAGIAARFIYAGTWLWEGRPLFVDADCYTRMARVARILCGEGPFFSRHSFENFPIGISTHTTFPLDGLLVLATKLIQPFHLHSIDWAGAVIGPLLFAALFYVAWKRSNQITVDPWILLTGIALLPALVWATPFARPDHQALLVTVIGIALILEPSRWHENSRCSSAIAGICWGISLWTSFFEPLIILLGLLAFNALNRRKEQPWFLGGIALVLAIQGVTEGYHLQSLSRLDSTQLMPWFQTIGELRPLGFREFLLIFTPFTLLIPFLFWDFARRNALKREVILWTILTVFILGASLLQRRWMYFAGIPLLFLIGRWVSLLSLPIQVGFRLLFLAACLAGGWKIGWNPNAEPPLASEARRLCESIKTPGAILAPWWISPSLLYYSGQPIVSSSSHESIEGILDSALFFTAHHWPEALSLLDSRQVRWVVVYDSERLIENSRQVLQEKSNTPVMGTVAGKLWSTLGVPTSLQLRTATPNLRLYEYVGTQK
jgi:hypothetical protein